MQTPQKAFLFLFAAVVSIGAIALILQLPTPETENAPPSTDTSTPDTEGPVVESGPAPKLFLEGIPEDKFDTLALDDFPSTLDQGWFESAVAWREFVFVGSTHHILKYDREGNLVGITDRAQIDCSPRLALAGDTLYGACLGVGMYEIDLLKNEVAYFFDRTNGLPSVDNLLPVVQGEVLWVGTFDGLARIDQNTRVVKAYRADLGISCQSYGTVPYVNGEEVWATVTAHSTCAGGAARYNASRGTWTFFGPEVFQDSGYERIDFHLFAATDTGAATIYQLNSDPNQTTLNVFNTETETWTREMTVGWNELDLLRAKLPPAPANPAESFVETRYLAMERTDAGRYYLLSTDGLATYDRGDAFPRHLVDGVHGGYEPWMTVITSSEQEAVVGMTKQTNDMCGTVYAYSVSYFELNGPGFSAVVSSPEAAPSDTNPCAGENDRLPFETIGVLFDGDELSLGTSEGVPVIRIIPAEERIELVE